MDLQQLNTRMTDLTTHQLKIVQALYDAGDNWLTRSKVAKALDKRRLTPYDIDCLNLLSDKCLIKTSTQPTRAPGSDFAYIYKLPDEIADLLQTWVEERKKPVEETPRKHINISDDE